MHDSAKIGTTWNKSLRLWQDSHGLAIELDIPATMDGLALRNMIAGPVGISAMSFGLIPLQVNYLRNEDGCRCREVTRCDVDHISIVECGAYSSSCCWLSDMPADRMSPKIAAASRHWYLGRIHHDQKKASNRAMLARYLAAKAAPARRRPGPMVIPEMPAAMIAARRLGICF